MSLRWLGAVAVAAIALSIVGYKQVNSESVAPNVQSKSPSVVLYADLGEAESPCGCGQIIRLIRGARDSGVAVREIAPGTNTAFEREHRVTVGPTVLFLDPSGHEVARHEGESPETIEALSAQLAALAKKP